MSNVFFYEPFYDIERLLDGTLWRHPVQVPPNNVNAAPSLQRRNDNNDNVDGAVRSFRPRMDLHEDDEKNLVTATFELPGVKKEDIQIDLAHGRLTISAEVKQDTERNEEGYAVRERRIGKFARTLNVPQGTKDEEIKAAMENGVLTVTFPKASPEQPPTKITIA